jgi:hypothetical protein
MSTLEKVQQLQQQGLSEDQISAQLKQEGVSPKEIETAMNQSQIKSAVSQSPSQDMQGSIMDNKNSPQTANQQSTPPEQTEQGWEGYTQTPDTYSQQQYYQPQQISNTETISEIAEQVVEEKISPIKDTIEKLVSVQNQVSDTINDLNERLEKIEKTIEMLEKEIIREVGDFGESNALVRKDLNNLHNTMSKMMNPLMDNYKEMKKLNTSKSKTIS